MNKKLIRLTEQFLIMSGLQVVIVTYLKTAVAPSFFLVWILIVAWEGDAEIALGLAFITGIVYDVISRGVIGTTSVIFLFIVYLNCFLAPKSMAGRFAGAFISSMVYLLVFLFEYQKGFLWGAGAILKYSLLFSLWNSLILVVIEFGMRKLRWRKKEYLSI
ncbi:MAG: rod shape-determining protein MreD [Candidatus Omnitrophica bacterium]|nr:rod shape-determining protein MreD [Candidatus Omnitrophota bacterium]